MPTWIDDEGRLRERVDDRHQFLCHVPLEHLDPWVSYDSWRAELAIRLITIGYDLDIDVCWDEAKNWPNGCTGLDAAYAYIEVYQRGMSIAQSSVEAGLLKNPDTPANWLAWAKRKGYDVAHLEPRQTESATDTATPTPVVAANCKTWTTEKLAELKAYREGHTMPQTAEKFAISEQRIRQLLPSGKSKAKPFAGLIHRMR